MPTVEDQYFWSNWGSIIDKFTGQPSRPIENMDKFQSEKLLQVMSKVLKRPLDKKWFANVPKLGRFG